MQAMTSSTCTSSSSSSCPCDWWRLAIWKKPFNLMDLSGHGHGGSSSSSRGSTRSSSGNGNLQEERGEIQIENTREMERTLGLFDLIMIGIGGTVGAGVFATAGLIANVYAGPAAILSWLIAGLGCILSGFSFMELSCLIPSSGSTYAYAYHTLGELPAMFAGFLLSLEYGISSAGGARSWSDKFTTWLDSQFQIQGPEWMKPKDSTMDLYAGLLMTICVLIVLTGMQAGKTLINIVTMTKISVVLFIICVGLLKFDIENITPFIPPSSTNSMGQVVFGWPGIFLGASASFFGYIGYDEVCCLAGEAKNPQYTIPRAVIGTIIGASFLSVMATFSLVGLQKYTDIDKEESYGKAFEHVGWYGAAAIVSTGEIITMPITTFIGFMAQPRVQYAMAKDGLLPPIFARVNADGNLFEGTLICGIILIFVAVFIPFKILWDFISLGILVAFNLTNCALLVVRYTNVVQKSTNTTTTRTTTTKSRSTYRSLKKRCKSKKRIAPYVIVSFLVSSFLAAFHWQKSVLGITKQIEDAKSGYFYYLQKWGPKMASFFTCIMVGLMYVLKKIENISSSSPKPKRKHSNVALRRIPLFPLEEEEEEEDLDHICRSHSSSSSSGSEMTGIIQVRYLESGRKIKKRQVEEDHQLTRNSTHREDNHGRLLSKEHHLHKDKSKQEEEKEKYLKSHEDMLDNQKEQQEEEEKQKEEEEEEDKEEEEEEEDKEDKEEKKKQQQMFHAPFVPFAPCFAIFFNWFLFAQMNFSAVVLICLWLGFAFVIYLSYSIKFSLAKQQEQVLLYHHLN